ncbi:putative conserved protein YciI|nr:putative conserved protein YciI [Candidatus Pantoea persica]
MYIVSLSYVRPMEEVEALLAPHIQWLDRYFAAKVFIVAGRKDPRTGGHGWYRAGKRYRPIAAG